MNDEMVEVLRYALHDMVEADWDCHTQAVVNAAWTKFDPDDESTWPRKDMTYLVIDSGFTNSSKHMTSCKFRDGKWWLITDLRGDIAHYADPQDLMFKEI